MATFGKTTVGGSNSSITANSVVTNGYSLAEDGYVTKITFYVANPGAAQKLRQVLYADSSGSPGALKGTTNEVTIGAGQAAGWVDFSFPSPVHLASGTYYIGVWGGTTSDAAFRYYDATGTLKYNTAVTYSSTNPPPDPFPSPSSATQQNSGYATYDSTPVNSVAPSVSGNAPVGQTLSTTNGTWTQSPSFTYAWTRDGSPIGGATSSTYVTVSADVGHAVGCTVTATNGVATASQASSNTVTVTAATHRSNNAVPQRRRHHTGRRGR